MPRKLSKILTDRQREVFEFIKRTIKTRGYSPTVREIGDEVKINSPNGVIGHLRALIKKGLITRQPNLSRSIQLVNPKADSVVRTGATISQNKYTPAVTDTPAAEEQIVPIDGVNMFVTVTDDSLSESKVLPGDVIVVRTGVSAREGQTILATAKTGKVSLLKWGAEADRKMGLNHVEDSTQCPAVIGIAVGLLRKL